MTGRAEQLLREAKLGEALAVLAAHLRDQPDDLRARTSLFELLCFAGEFDRAEKHLNLLSAGSQETAAGALLYQGALHAERMRREMFEKSDYPPPPSAPLVTGALNGRAFGGISDADPRIGPRLEVFAAGTYMFIPWEHVASIEMQAPRRLRDLLWAPARVKTGPAFRDFDFGELLLPALCPLTHQAPDDEVRLGRATAWYADDQGREFPAGLKMLLVDGEEFPILEIRSLQISCSTSASA